MPPREAKQWTEAEIDDLLDQRIGRLFDRLYEIEPKHDDNDQPEPVVLGLSAAGKAAWVEFYDQHAQRQADASGEQAAALAKAEGAAARLASGRPLRARGGRGPDGLAIRSTTRTSAPGWLWPSGMPTKRSGSITCSRKRTTASSGGKSSN